MSQREIKRFSGGSCPPERLMRGSVLLGNAGISRLMNSTVFVIGLGGVGSWAAESLARSGVGKLYLMDFDKIETSNINRQIQANPETVGRSKANELAVKLNVFQNLDTVVVDNFIDGDFLEKLGIRPDYIVEAIDIMNAKCSILNWSVKNKIPVVSSMGSAGKISPWEIRAGDLSRVQVCPMGRDVRRILRKSYDFPISGNFGINAVWSMERPVASTDPSIKGSLVQVTMAFGAALSAFAIRDLALPEDFEKDI
ncbi:MAG: ThiF family adenylyltransferase [Deltaproteobacteria bacterium]|nr:ThiF family adenylyltransferase [Deltaproteobacteria bacterium]